MENGEPDFGPPPGGRQTTPSWRPSDDVLPAIVPIEQFLIHAEWVVIVLSHASVYPNGCLLDVRASARGHDAAPAVFENIVFTAQFGTGPPP